MKVRATRPVSPAMSLLVARSSHDIFAIDYGVLTLLRGARHWRNVRPRKLSIFGRVFTRPTRPVPPGLLLIYANVTLPIFMHPGWLIACVYVM